MGLTILICLIYDIRMKNESKITIERITNLFSGTMPVDVVILIDKWPSNGNIDDLLTVLKARAEAYRKELEFQDQYDAMAQDYHDLIEHEDLEKSYDYY